MTTRPNLTARAGQCLIAGLAGFGTLYLIGAFIAADFDIRMWNVLGRMILGVFGFGAAAASAVLVWENSA